MAAPTTLAILQERLYALGVEAAELRQACVTPTGATNDQRSDLRQVAKVIDRFVRDFKYGGSGRSAVSAASAVSSDFAERSGAELAAHVATLIDTSDATATIASLTAVIEAVGQDGDIEVEAIDA